ncbi:MAG: hypothetical protein JXR34_11545 [Bacteroidales bacterium]|nr:hypothetical protein [Bacteroidales bacterium]
MKTLKPEVSKKFDLVTIRPGSYTFPKYGPIDLTAITLAEAEELFENGFPYLKRKQILEKEIKSVNSPTLHSALDTLPAQSAPKFPDGGQITDFDKLRNNKRFINKLLTLSYPELTFQEKAIFYNDEMFFNDKRYALQDVSKLDAQMKSLHAKLKLSKKQSDRKALVKDLLYLESIKIKGFEIIDTWLHEPAIEETEIEKAAREALETANEIQVLTNYIGRFEKIVNAMPETTEKLKEKKAVKLTEIEKRKERLIALNAPYKRVIRK